jgi:hypothetical protein
MNQNQESSSAFWVYVLQCVVLLVRESGYHGAIWPRSDCGEMGWVD